MKFGSFVANGCDALVTGNGVVPKGVEKENVASGASRVAKLADIDGVDIKSTGVVVGACTTVGVGVVWTALTQPTTTINPSK